MDNKDHKIIIGENIELNEPIEIIEEIKKTNKLLYWRPKRKIVKDFTLTYCCCLITLLCKLFSDETLLMSSVYVTIFFFILEIFVDYEKIVNENGEVKYRFYRD